jgi:gamma-glutamyltranspeptidase
VSILRKGGSAVDALVAAAAVQCVVENGSTTVAGMWLSNSYDAASGRTTRVTAKIGPAAAGSYDYEWESREVYSGRTMPVPGWPAGAYRAWEEDGRLSWGEALEPAIALAEDGFELDPATHPRADVDDRRADARGPRALDARRALPRRRRAGRSACAREDAERARGRRPAAFYEGEFARHHVDVARERGGAQLVLYRDGAPWAVAASPGHSCVHAPLAFTVGLVQRRLDPAAAMAAPRFGLPSPLTSDRQPFKSHYPRTVFAVPEDRGLPCFECSPSSILGRVTAVAAVGDCVHALHDPRADGAAAAFTPSARVCDQVWK